MNTHIPAAPHEADILAAAYETTMKARAGRSFPSIRSQAWLGLPHDDKVASLLVLACAWLAEDPRRQKRDELKEVSNAIHGGAPRGWWARHADDPARRPIRDDGEVDMARAVAEVRRTTGDPAGILTRVSS